MFEPHTCFDRQPLPALMLSRPTAVDGVTGLEFLSENVMGELDYAAFIGQLISEDEAPTLARAWRADRICPTSIPVAVILPSCRARTGRARRQPWR
jgi:hypothetical protein